MKKVLSLKTILIFLGSFVVINAVIYFFLKATQPKSAVPALAAQVEYSDSLQSRTDSTAYLSDELALSEQEADADTSEDKEPSVHPAEETVPRVEATDPVVESTPPDESAAEVAPPEVADPEEQATDLADAVAEGDPRQLQRLAKLLGAMKAEQAAPIMTRLSDETIVALFMSMRERSAAKVMAILPVDQAARVSNLMTQMVNQASR